MLASCKKIRIWPPKRRRIENVISRRTFKPYWSRMKKLYPLYTWIKDRFFNYPFNLQGLIDFKWWFLHRFHPSHRYHIMKTGLKPGWHDYDSLILHVAFKNFVDHFEYIEEHDGEENEYDPAFKKIIEQQKKKYTELIRLREWWLVERPNDYEKLEELYNTANFYTENKTRAEELAFWKKATKFEKRLYDKDTKKLVELIKLRGAIWI